jgi:hypothetical protein
MFTGAGTPQGAQITFGVAATLPSEPAIIANAVKSAIQDSDLLGNVGTATAITLILVKCGPNETGPMFELATNIPGEVGAQCVPPNTSVLFKKTTPQGGRRGQGRFFLPCVPETAVDNSGLLSDEYRVPFQTAADEFLDALEASGIPMLLLHSTERSGELPLPVTKLSVSNRVATQRRRMR